jgi:hypothetical protein
MIDFMKIGICLFFLSGSDIKKDSMDAVKKADNSVHNARPGFLQSL